MRSYSIFKRSNWLFAVALGFVAMTPWHGAEAAAAQIGKTDATYYRFMLGRFEVTALSDGTTPLPVDQLLTHTTPERVKAMLAASHIGLPFEMNFNAYLVNTGSKLVLIDTGAGTLFGPNLGRMAAALKASGYAPEQIDEIYITHLHPDHVGGLVSGGKAVFPRAVVRIDQAEGKFWLSHANLEKAAADEKPFFEGAQQALKPYVDAGRYRPFEGAAELIPGIKAQPLAGHTPGHTTYLLESDGQKMLVWGDVIHVGPIQFAHPDIAIHFDVDSKAAQAARMKLLAEAARQGYWIAAAHLSFPGIGHVQVDGKHGYRWLPAEYSAIH